MLFAKTNNLDKVKFVTFSVSGPNDGPKIFQNSVKSVSKNIRIRPQGKPTLVHKLKAGTKMSATSQEARYKMNAYRQD